MFIVKYVYSTRDVASCTSFDSISSASLTRKVTVFKTLFI